MFNIEWVISPLFTVLFGSIVGYLLLKRLRKEAISVAFEIIETKQEELMQSGQDLLNSEEGQKLLYSIGALIGNGAMAGTGLKKKSGKFQWQDLAAQVVGSFIQKKVGINPIPQNNPQIDRKPNIQNAPKVRSA